jgi:hypothetical protein
MTGRRLAAFPRNRTPIAPIPPKSNVFRKSFSQTPPAPSTLCDRIATAQKHLNLSAEEARRWVEKADRDRTNFVKDRFYKNPDDSRLYGLVLNSSRFSTGECADQVTEALRRMQERASKAAKFAVPVGQHRPVDGDLLPTPGGEHAVRSVANLTRRDGEEFLALAARVPVRAEVKAFPLAEANEAIRRLCRGLIRAAAVFISEKALDEHGREPG